ncbi:MAG: hypothetical protein A2Y23_07290 [Clostridiales bacterium GWB2_37_7]|nr:MAG: hypothetical protein A2Y23_07290 [Clostridiales bacterium GWB2_37_7]
MVFKQENSPEFINVTLTPKDTKKILEVYVSKIAVCYILGSNVNSSNWQVLVYDFNTQEQIKELYISFENKTKLYNSKSNSCCLLQHNEGVYIDQTI